MNKLMKYVYYLVQRAKEPSTWSAIAVLAGTVGYNLGEEWQAKAVGASVAAFLVINILWKKDTQVTGTGDGNS